MATLIRGLLIEDETTSPVVNLLQFSPEDPLQIECERSLSTCINRLEAGLFDILIVNLDLPDAEVVDVITSIVQRLPSVPIVVITQHEDPSLDREVLRRGAQDYLCRRTLQRDTLCRSLRLAVERHRHTSDLRERLDDLERFHGTVVHELRASLARSSALISWATWGVGKDRAESVRETLHESHDQLETMDTMLDQLWEHAQSGRGLIDRCSVDLNQCVDQALDEMAALHGGALTRVQRGPLPRVLGDSILLKNLFRHLISNTQRQSTSHEPQLCIRLAESESDVFEVVDEGLHVDPSRLDLLFQELDIAEAGQDSLGLFLGRRIVEQHGGVIWAERSALGGTSIRFTLPVESQRTAAGS